MPFWKSCSLPRNSKRSLRFVRFGKHIARATYRPIHVRFQSRLSMRRAHLRTRRNASNCTRDVRGDCVGLSVRSLGSAQFGTVCARVRICDIFIGRTLPTTHCATPRKLPIRTDTCSRFREGNRKRASTLEYRVQSPSSSSPPK